MRATIEDTLSGKIARSVVGLTKNKSLNGPLDLRVVTLETGDPDCVALSHAYSRGKGKGFYGWKIKRQYSALETERAHLHFFQIKAGILPTGGECGTAYDDRDMYVINRHD